MKANAWCAQNERECLAKLRPRWAKQGVSTILAYLSILICSCVWSGCSWYKNHIARSGKSDTASNASTTSGQEGAPEQNSPTFSVNIEYANKRDYLRTLTVVEYPRAQLLMIRRTGDEDRSLVRFSGGATIWRIEAKTIRRTLLSRKSPLSVLSDLPGPTTKVNSSLRLASVSYGKVPRGFVQTVPSVGPPDPLEPGEYYMVRVEREFGVTNYEVVRLEPNGEITAYDAEPRAGDSYELCCNVPASFFERPQQSQGAEELEQQNPNHQNLNLTP